MALLMAGAAAGWADVDLSEYESRSIQSSPLEQERTRREIEQERAAESLRAAQEAQRLARKRTEEDEARAARPYGERLLEVRCTVCHEAANYETKRHTRLGWWLVVLRMRHLNGAHLASGEPGAIVAELARTHGADGGQRLLEYGALATALIVVPLLARSCWRALRRWRDAWHHERR